MAKGDEVPWGSSALTSTSDTLVDYKAYKNFTTSETEWTDISVKFETVSTENVQYYMNIPAPMVGDFDTELLREFFVAFAFNSAITLHIKQLDGVNSHHLIEGAFKSVARTLKKAVAIDETMKNEIPSSKGVL